MTIISICQYQIESHLNWVDFSKKVEQLLYQAKQQQAQILLLPEYAGIEIGGRHPTEAQLFKAIQPMLSRYCELFQDLSQSYQLYIQPGTIPVLIDSERYVNRAYFFSPDRKIGYQDKLQLTGYEKEAGLFLPGQEQVLFETTLGQIGIAICYDSEFPEIVRPLTQAGATLVLVPSYAPSQAAFYRVLLSSRARAIENQCYVATAFVVDKVDSCDPIDMTFGQSALLGPADSRFPDDGVIATASLNKPDMISCQIDIEKLKWVRASGQVHNFEDALSLSKKNLISMVF